MTCSNAWIVIVHRETGIFAILRLMTDLGLRGAEIIELCLEDIDWEAGALAVRPKH